MGRSRFRLATALALAGFSWFAVGNEALAGGSEFPADGTRGLGRGGTGFLRADDPTVMMRNPALLADLWDDQALLGAHLLLVDACFTPTGAYGWDVPNADVSDYGDGPAFLNPPEGAVDLQGNPIVGFADEPFPEICYDGPAPFLPMFALSTKLGDDLGIGIGFLPPESQMLSAFGGPDGTIDTENGARPNPLRYNTTNQNVSFFTVSTGIGYRLADWIRVGATLQWNLVVANARSWTTAIDGRQPRNDVATDVFFRDLFVPGITASVHVTPIEAIDVGASFKWTERLDGKAKLDLTSGFFGTSEVFEYRRQTDDPNAAPRTVSATIPTTTNNQPGFVFAPPIYAPQLAMGIRYADRIMPGPSNWKQARRAAGRSVLDHMATERWDIELEAIYYFTSTFDEIGFRTKTAGVKLRSVDANGTESAIDSKVGDCTVPEVMGSCPTERVIKSEFGGKDQFTVRLGGDYNILPGIFSLRAGFSYEADGQDVEYLNIRNYMLQRYGLHAGFTLRVADKTDISFGFAQFIHKDVRLQVNGESQLPPSYRSREYNFIPGRGIDDPIGGTPPDDGAFDGTAKYEVPSAGTLVGPHYVNAGSFVYSMQALSLSFTQHF